MMHADNLRQIADGFADAYGTDAMPRTRRWLLSAAQYIEALERRAMDEERAARTTKDARR
jgi:hypothetical protein